jgi:hypothetical protein
MKQQRNHYRAEEKTEISLEAISYQLFDLRKSEMRLTSDKSGNAVGPPSWRSSFLRDPGAEFLGGKLNKQKTH